MSRDSRSYYQSSSSSTHPANDGNALPPIRELFSAELGRPSSPHPRYAQYRQATPIPRSIKMEETVESRSLISSRSAHHLSQPAGGHIPKEEIPNIHSGSYSYGVLRTSAISGTLTNAIPPSTTPQGIIRQTSHSTAHESDDPSKKHVCGHCGKRFAMPSHYQIHLRSHTAERPFVCQWPGCARAFTVKGNLTRHLRTHERPDGSQSPSFS
ncbi:hypothetical protein M422DRAFT_774031 [Sphaerobolus stellatus SS14]|nr:hypothetical protein M422DRAFT_774031 [Sphaerobolus stellatus SS14]